MSRKYEACATLRQDVRGRHAVYRLDGTKASESRSALVGWNVDREAAFKEWNFQGGAGAGLQVPLIKKECPEAVLPPARTSTDHQPDSTALDSPDSPDLPAPASTSAASAAAASAAPPAAQPSPPLTPNASESRKSRNRNSECVDSVAKTLADGLNFTDYYLNQLETMPVDSLPGDYVSALDLIADRMDQGETDSTSFSGVEAPMCARRMLHYALEQRLQRKIREPKVLHMVEWDSACQQELLSMDEDACLYGDVSGFFCDELAGLIAALKKNPSLALETLAPLLEQKKLVKRSAYCLRHKQPDCMLKVELKT